MGGAHKWLSVPLGGEHNLALHRRNARRHLESNGPMVSTNSSCITKFYLNTNHPPFIKQKQILKTSEKSIFIYSFIFVAGNETQSLQPKPSILTRPIAKTFGRFIGFYPGPLLLKNLT
jgi:hypothetical protein